MKVCKISNLPGGIYSSSPPDTFSLPVLWTFWCRRRLDTTEKWRPQPSTSHLNAEFARFQSVLLFGHWFRRNLRFSPVWLYMCVCREEGRVNRLSQILHLCFFCVLEGILELNWVIMAWGAGGAPAVNRFDGRGRVLEERLSKDSEVVEL